MNRTTIAMAAGIPLLAFVGAAIPSTASALPSTPQPTVTQRYIVEASSGSSANGLAVAVRRSGGQVDKTYTKVFAGFSATMTAQQVKTLRASGGVESITQDRVFHSTSTPVDQAYANPSVTSSRTAQVSSTPLIVQASPTWGLDRIDQRANTGNKSYSYQTTGAGVTAFVVDTGIRFSHTQFGGRATSGYDFADRDTNASDCNGHGTHVSGTIGGSTYGVAKKVKLVSVRVLDCQGSGWASDIIDAMDWIIAHKPAGPSVVNMSIGGDAFAPLDQAVARTVAAGIPVVVAAGNDDENACSSSPARVRVAITVAASDSKDNRAPFSNYGSCVDLFAPGVDVKSASNSSNTATELMSGTSMATPHVVGVVARYLQAHPKSTPAQTASALVAASTTNVVKDAMGSPNRLLYAAPLGN